MDPDMNNYDLEHVCADHPIMSAETWRGVYRDAWARYYSDAHVETVLRRALASGINPRKIVDAMTVFSGSSRIEGVHPLQFGYVRRKIRTQRRHGMAIVHPLIFYPWRAFDFFRVAAKWAALALRYRAILRRVLADKEGAAYVDESLIPPTRSGPERRFRDRFRRQDPGHLRRPEAGGRARGGVSGRARSTTAEDSSPSHRRGVDHRNVETRFRQFRGPLKALRCDPTLTFGVGSNANGISNNGQVVGTQVDVNNVPTGANYTGTATNTSPLAAAAGQTAFGINSAGDVVGGSGSSAFYLPNGGTLQTLTTPAGADNAFGINDLGNIVGQYTAGADTPGFYLPSVSSTSFTTIDQPPGAASTVVNAQGVNNKGLIVGFYLGNDGQAHGFDANIANASGGTLVGTAIADPTIPSVPGEPGATFVFSQVLGVNDEGIAVGY